MSARGISDLERGARSAPRAETLALLAAALGLDPADRDDLFASVRRGRTPGAGNAPEEAPPAPPVPPYDEAPNNLPAQLTSFIGRERELAAVQGRLAEHRLVTLTGAGGTGKTRLALQTAAELLARFPDGVWLVELAPLTDPARVPGAVASVLGVAEEPGRTLTDKLIATVRQRALLLVLDNCEHLIEACASLADALLRGSTGPRVLATSRETLGIVGEAPFRVPSLALPPRTGEQAAGLAAAPLPLPAIEAAEAVRLFLARARAVQPTFRLTPENARPIVNICHRLDGIPLAIELATARLRVLTVEGIDARLDDRFRLLAGGSRGILPRHQTLRALIDWSYHLLTDDEQLLLRRLSVFAGGWTLEAAEAVGGVAPLAAADVLDLLTRLVDKSLVIVGEDAVAGDMRGEPHYRLLETVRQYAHEHLRAAGEEDAARRQHLAWFAALASDWRRRTSEQSVEQFREIAPELDNFRAAIEFGLGGADPHAVLQLVGDLHWFWLASGLMHEGRRWAERAIAARSSADPPDAALVRAIETRGSVEWRQAEYGVARAMLTEAVALGRTVGDESALEAALLTLGGCLRDSGDLVGARRTLEEAIARAEAWERQINIAQGNFQLGLVAIMEGRVAEAAERLRLAERLGRQLHWIRLNHVLRALATLASLRDDYAAARRYLEEGVSLARASNERDGISFSLQELGIVCLAANDLAGAERAFTEGLPPTSALGRQSGLVVILLGLAEIARRRGAVGTMRRQLAEVRDLLMPDGSRLQPGGVLADPVVRAHWVAAVASLLALTGASRSAARLLGAIAAHRPPAHEPTRPQQLAARLWLAREGALAATLRDELGEGAFAALNVAGRSIPLDEAVAEAAEVLLSVDDRP